MHKVGGFDWDEGNRRKCTSHGVTVAEIEDVFENDPQFADDAEHSGSETRARAIGKSKFSGRYIFIVFTIRLIAGHRLIRPISARYMHRKEISRYEQTRS